MIYLLDTTAVSDLMREHQRVQENMANVGRADRVVVCSIVRGEILFGIERLARGKRRSDLEAKASQVFDVTYCYPVLEAAADHYARVKSDCLAKGIPLDENDLWIAATALAIGATIVTRDADYDADYNSVDGLPVVDWTQ